ncbi:hypothetical protein PISMIDRAFT_349986 [Pisolithus microcarpus 441]|uniref:Uncharacterized protein n=1 Tax=Pisolithus microcarpus 441 TaxID=765257 RepID=A0A0C9YK58_9AGAM|nr:hypothetical protein PISMIDRAFT_349986 [Pisolithus microcarpus 441]
MTLTTVCNEGRGKRCVVTNSTTKLTVELRRRMRASLRPFDSKNPSCPFLTHSSRSLSHSSRFPFAGPAQHFQWQIHTNKVDPSDRWNPGKHPTLARNPTSNGSHYRNTKIIWFSAHDMRQVMIARVRYRAADQIQAYNNTGSLGE